MFQASRQPRAASDINYPAAIPFILVHVSCLAAVWTGVTWRSIALCAALYWIRIFAIGAGYHRYFSHRAFSTSRLGQFALAFLAQTSAQSSVLWWASKHRRHHLYSDTPLDTHSALHRGIFYSHVGWIFDRTNTDTDLTSVDDLGRYRELRLLHRFELAPALMVAIGCFALAGWSGVVVGFLWSTVLVWHATFCINSLAHLRGTRRYLTGDQSRNNWLLAIVTMGEGWHNNHHAYQSSARQGFRWWQYDPTFYLLWMLEKVGLIWDLKRPPVAVVRNEQRIGGRVLERTSEQLAHRARPGLIAQAILLATDEAGVRTLKAALANALQHSGSQLSALHLPQLPTREDLVTLAKRTLAETTHLDEIVDRARTLVIEAVHAALPPLDDAGPSLQRTN